MWKDGSKGRYINQGEKRKDKIWPLLGLCFYSSRVLWEQCALWPRPIWLRWQRRSFSRYLLHCSQHRKPAEAFFGCRLQSQLQGPLTDCCTVRLLSVQFGSVRVTKSFPLTLTQTELIGQWVTSSGSIRVWGPKSDKKGWIWSRIAKKRGS